jgi:hypothetical protein
MTQSDAISEARQRLGEKATARVFFGLYRIGYSAPDGSLITVGKGCSWESALREAFGSNVAARETVGGKS